MIAFKDFFRLIRFPNLLIIFLTQYAIRFGIIQPFLHQSGLELFLPEKMFFYLSLATVLIAAAGYIINDYFDVKLDIINKPKQTIIGKSISRRAAMLLHMLINIIGLGLALKVALSISHPFLFLFQFLSAGALWYYSVSFKKMVLVGNGLIAGLTALVPFTSGYYELASMYDSIGMTEYHKDLGYMLYNLKYILYYVIGYSAFAFLLTLIREIAKDIEDIEGDKAYDCKTLPIVYGINFSKRIAIGISVFTSLWILALMLIQWYTKDYISFSYFLLFLFFPLLFVIYRFAGASEKRHFFIISQAIKVIMLFGVMYTGIIYYFQP